MKKLSIVTCSYNAQDTILNFINSISKICIDRLKIKDFEIIIVDDVSIDNTVELVRNFIKKNKIKIKLITLIKNSGNHIALREALKHVNGNLIFEIDSDLEIDPKQLEIFYNKYKTGKYDLIYGFQKNRNSGFITNVFSTLYYLIIKNFSEIDIPINQLQLRMYNSVILERINGIKNIHQHPGILIHSLKLKKIGLNVNKKNSGKSNYTFFKRMNLLINAIMIYTRIPYFIMGSIVGIFFILCTIMLIFFGTNIFDSLRNSGWLFVSALILFTSGLNLVFLALSFYQIRNIQSEINATKNNIISEIISN